ncbi:MAG: 5'/3'-nucleotidase SurE [Lentisphaeria bacterium]|nr:5'/3'-nucleotidase SurE [Lentisphaeria bacterium]NQZ67405.1 5'/3'-nucleotidase SurE [Lentisphaeria bacterium]
MNILIVNDDSVDSPFLELLIEQIPAEHNCHIVVPAEEQSWKGKAMTRFGELAEKTETINGRTVHCIYGTPADCANIGIYHNDFGLPDCVISGINIGHNAGVAYIFSSGTVGAAIEANIAGIPALSLSQLLPNELFDEWINNRSLTDSSMDYFRKQLDQVFPKVWEKFQPEIQAKNPITWNVNFPGKLAADWELKSARCGLSFYGSCFKKTDDTFKHDAPKPQEDQGEDSDVQIILSGHVSVTKLDMRSFGQDKIDF